jgi:hypothetical protein
VGQTTTKHGGTSTLNSFIRSATIYFKALQVCFNHKDKGSTIEGRVKEGNKKKQCFQFGLIFPSHFLYFLVCVRAFFEHV